jgi:hypothetical protein
VIEKTHDYWSKYIHVRAQKGYYLEQACTKCTYKRHIAIKQEVDIHEAGDKAIEKYMQTLFTAANKCGREPWRDGG